MTKLYDVVIAGAGPVGLFLACELRLANASVLILEYDSKSDSPWKDPALGRRGMNTLSTEHFYRRGLLSKLFNSSERPLTLQTKPGFQFGGHFAGIALNVNKLDLSRRKYLFNGPSLIPGLTDINTVEGVLTERAESLGVTIIRNDGLTSISKEDDNSVTVEAGESGTFQGRWLVGCDGGRSTVRKAAGFDFVGTEPTFTGYAAKCEWDHPERLKPGFHHSKNGFYITVGPGILYLTDFDGGAFDRSQPITQSHLQEIFTRVSGITEVQIQKIHIATSFTDRCKQTTSYRKGRILLAGDAAHIHGPVGSQGLNVGLGDAMNLGWKLAATLRREDRSDGPLTDADLALLDTYERERHPMGAWVLDWTRGQVALMQPGEHIVATRSLMRDLADTTDGANMLIDRHWGLNQRYDLGDEHPLVGSSMPDLELEGGDRLGKKLEGGNGLLVELDGDGSLRALFDDEMYRGKLDYVGAGAKDTRGLKALLVRPDGIVAWVAEKDTKPDIDALNVALNRWFQF